MTVARLDGNRNMVVTDQSLLLVQKLCNSCNLLRDDGHSSADYVEQLTYLLFLKVAPERTQASRNRRSAIPAG